MRLNADDNDRRCRQAAPEWAVGSGSPRGHRWKTEPQTPIRLTGPEARTYWCRHCLNWSAVLPWITGVFGAPTPFEEYNHKPDCLVPLAQACAETVTR